MLTSLHSLEKRKSNALQKAKQADTTGNNGGQNAMAAHNFLQSEHLGNRAFSDKPNVPAKNTWTNVKCIFLRCDRPG